MRDVVSNCIEHRGCKLSEYWLEGKTTIGGLLNIKASLPCAFPLAVRLTVSRSMSLTMWISRSNSSAPSAAGARGKGPAVETSPASRRKRCTAPSATALPNGRAPTDISSVPSQVPCKVAFPSRTDLHRPKATVGLSYASCILHPGPRSSYIIRLGHLQPSLVTFRFAVIIGRSSRYPGTNRQQSCVPHCAPEPPCTTSYTVPGQCRLSDHESTCRVPG